MWSKGTWATALMRQGSMISAIKTVNCFIQSCPFETRTTTTTKKDQTTKHDVSNFLISGVKINTSISDQFKGAKFHSSLSSNGNKDSSPAYLSSSHLINIKQTQLKDFASHCFSKCLPQKVLSHPAFALCRSSCDGVNQLKG